MTRFDTENIRDADLLASINSGEFDNSSPESILQLLAKWCVEQKEVSDIRFFRALVTQLWIINQRYANGEAIFISSDQPGSLSLTPSTVRRFLTTGLESSITERYGAERAETEIRNFYLLMLDSGQGLALTLSPFGVEVLTEIHRSILQDAVYGSSRAKRGLH
ncbi:hypothetical protein O4O00_21540 [Citrobacter sedlakii]|uniref:hypothetical protein n=1 Tax=Citrobacter sedlakii TaxID=67826 RepID=UPI0022B3518D|nr:hypothetical protein [Citrobacter sedlakii]MCZ4676944.1 hypothetical protein [Citrobacter sedlakii]MDR5007001.1 hypothetical protein [Citrobacter sedlakii]